MGGKCIELEYKAKQQVKLPIMKSFLVFSAVRSTSILIWVFITEVRGRLNYGEAELYKPYKPEILQF